MQTASDYQEVMELYNCVFSCIQVWLMCLPTLYLKKSCTLQHIS